MATTRIMFCVTVNTLAQNITGTIGNTVATTSVMPGVTINTPTKYCKNYTKCHSDNQCDAWCQGEYFYRKYCKIYTKSYSWGSGTRTRFGPNVAFAANTATTNNRFVPDVTARNTNVFDAVDGSDKR